MKVFNGVHSPLSRSTGSLRTIMRIRSLLSAVGAAALGTAAYARFVEPRWIERSHTRVPVSGLPPALDGFRIALLTDFHAGEHTPLARVRRACRLAMEAQPHLIALTGDFVSQQTGAWLPDTVAALDEELRAPLGVWAVPGNHDHIAGIDRYYRSVHRQPNIGDLTNEAIRREHDGASVRVVGIDTAHDGQPHPAAAMEDAAPADFTLLLTHNPDLAEDACRAVGGADLVVSGHTHGGQVRLPFLGAVLNSAEHEGLYEAGLVRRPWAWVYVSRGIGTVRLPIRFLCRPEVAVLELVVSE
jgi:predicted MPP superfamily phosphohydrolase